MADVRAHTHTHTQMHACTSPFSRGMMREYSVVQMMSLSLLILSMVLSPKRSMQSVLEAMRMHTHRHVQAHTHTCTQRKSVEVSSPAGILTSRLCDNYRRSVCM